MKSFANKSVVVSALFTIVMLGSAASRATATAIIWTTPTDVNTSSDVSANGAFFDAGTVYSAANLVFGDTTFFRKNGTNTGFIGSGITLAAGTGGGAPGPTGNDYEKLISAGRYSTTGTITINNLLDGHDYEVQLWTPTWDNNFPSTFTATNSVTLNSGNTGAGGPPEGADITIAQYVLGTFTASGSTQVINFGGSLSLLAAIQVRDLTPAPEPGSLMLFICGCIGLVRLVRRRRS